MINEYQRSPLFLKYLFKTSSFILCETFLSQFFLHPEITITDVKQVFNKFNLLSDNSFDSFFTLLKWSGRIKLEPSENDKRKKIIRMTEKLYTETNQLTLTLISPLSDIFLSGKEIPYDTTDFFKTYSDIIRDGIFLFNLIDDCSIFVKKDGGHMIILLLYRLAMMSDDYIIENTQQEIAKLCSVSRSLIRKVFEEGAAKGLFSYTNDKKIIIEEKFLELAKNYMSYYFSYAAYANKITLKKSPVSGELTL
ncbi:MAG: hypothetical protein XXXJIFNMEKO3_01557 [Candidatus Erwinia impunctatus]